MLKIWWTSGIFLGIFVVRKRGGDAESTNWSWIIEVIIEPYHSKFNDPIILREENHQKIYILKVATESIWKYAPESNKNIF